MFVPMNNVESDEQTMGTEQTEEESSNELWEYKQQRQADDTSYLLYWGSNCHAQGLIMMDVWSPCSKSAQRCLM